MSWRRRAHPCVTVQPYLPKPPLALSDAALQPKQSSTCAGQYHDEQCAATRIPAFQPNTTGTILAQRHPSPQTSRDISNLAEPRRTLQKRAVPSSHHMTYRATPGGNKHYSTDQPCLMLPSDPCREIQGHPAMNCKPIFKQAQRLHQPGHNLPCNTWHRQADTERDTSALI